MKKKNVITLVMAAALACGAFAQSKKSFVPATIAPVKTVKALTRRLTAAARFPVALIAKKEDPKAKKTTTKGAAKPVAVTKLVTPATTRKNAASEKAIQPAAKTKPTKAVAPETKLAAKDARAKAPQLRANAFTNALTNDALRKGKFGKDQRAARSKPEEEVAPVRTARVTEIKRELKPTEPKRSVEPVIARRDRDDETPRRIRPRAVNDEPTDNAKESPKENTAAEERIADAPKLPIAKPDRIEVVEPNSPQLEQLQTLRNSRPLPSYGAIVTRTGTPPAVRKDISIPQQRVFEIQYELAKRGFYTAEPNGLYDDVTIAAMWEFQKNYGLPATGYPTAHALKRLGLTSW